MDHVPDSLPSVSFHRLEGRGPQNRRFLIRHCSQSWISSQDLSLWSLPIWTPPPLKPATGRPKMQAAKPAMPAQSLTPRQTAKQQQNHLSLARPRLRKAGLPASFSSKAAANTIKTRCIWDKWTSVQQVKNWIKTGFNCWQSSTFLSTRLSYTPILIW